MKKFVYFEYGNAYEAYINNAAQLVPEAYTFIPFRNKWIMKMQILHNAWPLNNKKELPLKKIWFKRALKGMDLSGDDEIYFLLYLSFHLSYSRRFLLYLKEKFPKSKRCFMYLNPVTDLIEGKIRKNEDCYEAIITFNEKDALTHGLLLCEHQPYRLPIYKSENLATSDVFFIGSDKGRLPKLISIYEKLSMAGLKCDFYIIGVPEDKQLYKDAIAYNKKISYEEVLQHVYATKCVLEVLQGNETYISIRTLEALQYHKKLLTENKKIKSYNFYDPQLIQVFSESGDIDISFIKKDIGDIKSSTDIPGRAEEFHQFLIENV